MAETIDMIQIRCPYKRKSKTNGKIYPCNKLYAKVASGSSGELYCTACERLFSFDTNGPRA